MSPYGTPTTVSGGEVAFATIKKATHGNSNSVSVFPLGLSQSAQAPCQTRAVSDTPPPAFPHRPPCKEFCHRPGVSLHVPVDDVFFDRLKVLRDKTIIQHNKRFYQRRGNKSRTSLQTLICRPDRRCHHTYRSNAAEIRPWLPQRGA